jgi:hypothetical protein
MQTFIIYLFLSSMLRVTKCQNIKFMKKYAHWVYILIKHIDIYITRKCKRKSQYLVYQKSSYFM